MPDPQNAPGPARPADSPTGTNAAPSGSLGITAARSAIGGLLMGLANLVPGVSGGTMLVVAGVFPKFIAGISELTRLRFRRESIVVVGVVGAVAACAIALGAGGVRDLVLNHRWVMYSLFIGWTLGGLPAVLKMARPMTRGAWVGVASGLGVMVAMALIKPGGGDAGSNPVYLFVGATIAAGAMVLPGISGGYVLLLLGLYVPVLDAVDKVKEALKIAAKTGDFSSLLDSVMLVIPIGLGVGLGIAGISNIAAWLLRRFPKPTCGVLVGLLLGALLGLWPFQKGVPPKAGDTIKGVVLTDESAAAVEAKDWPQEAYAPTIAQGAVSVLLIAGGVVMTLALARLSPRSREEGSGDQPTTS